MYCPDSGLKFRPWVYCIEQAERRLRALTLEKPLWIDSLTFGTHCRYKGGYWEARAASVSGDATGWATCPDIFGLGPKYGDVTQLLGTLAI